MKRPNFSTTVEALQYNAEHHADQLAFRFLEDGLSKSTEIKWGDFSAWVEHTASLLEQRSSRGDRVLILCEPGLHYIVAYLACLRVGRIAVPAYPPDPARLKRQLHRLMRVVEDANTKLAIASPKSAPLINAATAQQPLSETFEVLAVSEASQASQYAKEPLPRDDDIAFLQYTSGSTGSPKGVVVRHRQLTANIQEVVHSRAGLAWKMLSWLPPYHDMGLIAGILVPLYCGSELTFMSPHNFLMRPWSWMAAASKYQCNVSLGPNFALELACRKTSAEQLQELNLEHIDTLYIGAEPVRPTTVRRFMGAFRAAGVREDAIRPCFGLAENCLIVTVIQLGEKPRFIKLERSLLEQGKVVPPESDDIIELTVVGPATDNVEVKIVDPNTKERFGAWEVGELWVSGPSVTDGYWNNPKASAETFVHHEGKRWLRTGDFAFIDDNHEIVITGRIKDLIIVEGRNIYPQDLEQAAEEESDAIRPGCVAAFAIDGDDTERVVVVAEYDRRRAQRRQSQTPPPIDERRVRSDRRSEVPPLPAIEPTTTKTPEETALAVRKRLSREFQVPVEAVVFVKPGTIQKTSSGKIQRRATRKAYLAQELELLVI